MTILIIVSTRIISWKNAYQFYYMVLESFSLNISDIKSLLDISVSRGNGRSI